MILRFDLFLCHHDKHQVGDTAGAIQHYELAGTHCVEVPRMLFERGRVEDLEEYITQVPFVRPCLVSFPRNNPLIPSANRPQQACFVSTTPNLQILKWDVPPTSPRKTPL